MKMLHPCSFKFVILFMILVSGLPAPKMSNGISVDFVPLGCPNILNIGSNDVFYVAIIGKTGFHWNALGDITLNGVKPLSSTLLDQTGPGGTASPDCNSCNIPGPDGIPDLILQFDIREVAETLGNPSSGDCMLLTITTAAGTASDWVCILKKKK